MTKISTVQWLFITAVLVSMVFLSVVFGMVAYKFKLWPYPLLQNAYQAATAWQERLAPRNRYDNTSLFLRSRHTNSGIFRYNQEKAYNGFTLFTSAHASKAFLVSMEGEIVHEWHLPFYQVWPNPPHIEFPLPEDFIFWRKAHLYPNGDLLAIYTGFGDTPYGYGLVKVDKDSQLIWKYAGHVHHDVNVGSDGKIYTLVHEFVTEKIPGVKLEPPILEDSIVVLSPDGQELKKVPISKAFLHSDFSSVLSVLGEIPQKWDPWHINTVDVLEEPQAEKFPFLEKGQVLISIRNIDVVAVVDLEKEQVVWAVTGPWHRQHDPDFLANGNILLFDNRGYYNQGGVSRVIEFDPTTMAIVWQYTGNKQDTVKSVGKASQQRLPNGNTLITESYQGRIFEVTRDKEVVWEFISPFRAAHDSQLLAIVCWGQRFHPNSLHFDFSNLNEVK